MPRAKKVDADDWDQGNGNESQQQEATNTPPAVPPAQPAPGAPAVATPLALPQPEVKKFEPPKTLGDSLALWRKFDAMGDKERKAHAADISALRKHINDLQNGAAHPHIDANGQAAAQKNHARILRRQRLETLARQNPDVKELLAERDALAKTSETKKAGQK